MVATETFLLEITTVIEIGAEVLTDGGEGAMNDFAGGLLECLDDLRRLWHTDSVIGL